MFTRSLISLVLALSSLPSTLMAKDAHTDQRILGLPDRDPRALSGSQFVQKLMKSPEGLREKLIVDEILEGNIPEFQRQLVPVERKIQSGPYQGKKMRYWVLPDYLAIGSNEDFVRVPLSMPSIKVLAQKLNLSIPTTLMVDDIYSQAQIKLKPTTMPSGRRMTSVQYFYQHDKMVQSQLAGSRWKPGMLVVGHKKDVVQSLRLLQKPNAVAIYGWHTAANHPIQPLSTVHGAEYADYSHGVRFVSNIVEVNEKTLDLRSVLSQKMSETLARQATGSKPRS